jgi:hypothetical protein
VDLHYPYATEITGYPLRLRLAACKTQLKDPSSRRESIQSCWIMGDRRRNKSLRVALDPRLYEPQKDLKARLALDLKSHGALDTLNKGINQALAL